MIPVEFGYERAQSIEDALAARQRNPQAQFIAGGHSLLPLMKLRLAQPSHLIDIANIRELRTVAYQSDAISIGAAVRYSELLQEPRLTEWLPIVTQAASVIADPQVRHRGTIGGSAVHADPASDLAAIFLACEASFAVTDGRQQRLIPASEWYLGPLMSALAPGELLSAIYLPRFQPSRQAYVKFPHPASGYALAGAAALLDLNAEGRVRTARLAITGAGVAPFRARQAESRLEGQVLDPQTLAHAALEAAQAGEYADEGLYPADYRQNLARVMMQRALQRILEG